MRGYASVWMGSNGRKVEHEAWQWYCPRIMDYIAIYRKNRMTTDNGESSGVLGDGALHPGKYNMALVRSAIRKGYPIPDELKKKLIDQMDLVLGDAEDARDKIGAAKVIIAADMVNVRREAQPPQHLHIHGDSVQPDDCRATVLEAIDVELAQRDVPADDSPSDNGQQSGNGKPTPKTS